MLFLMLLSLFNLHAEETRIKVAVIDTGVVRTKEVEPFLCQDGHLDLTNTGMYDRSGHGTNVTSLIVDKLDNKRFCVIIIKWIDGTRISVEYANQAIYKSIVHAIDQGVKYINMSLSGFSRLPKEEAAIRRALKNGIVMSVAAGNDGVYLSKTNCFVYPACYVVNNKNYHVVGNIELSGARNRYSNYGPIVTDQEVGVNKCAGGVCLTGTSQSTAVLTNKLLRGI